MTYKIEIKAGHVWHDVTPNKTFKAWVDAFNFVSKYLAPSFDQSKYRIVRL